MVSVLAIMIIVNIIKGVILIFKNRRSLSLSLFITTIIYLAIPLLASFINLDKLESKVLFRACYEGTQNQAYILFRQDKTFELNWTGVFFYSKWYTGHWKRSGDTLTLKYHGDTVKALGVKVLIKNNYLNPIDNTADTTNKKAGMFYWGYCKGEN